MANLNNGGCYHDYKNLEINQEAIDSGLKKASKIYSNFLVNFIKECVETHSLDRPHFLELEVNIWLIKAVLKPYETFIE